MTIQNVEYYCETCWYTYDARKGDPEQNVKPGTEFDFLPEDWLCPDCGRNKSAFISRYYENT